MTPTLGLSAATAWTALVRRVPASTILAYVHQQWHAFAAHCVDQGKSLQSWKEPELTQALQAHLRRRSLAGQQPFDGDFLAENQTFDLDPQTCKPYCVARTDIEWLLFGFPRFTIEFKLLDGSSQLRTRYWRDGLTKFISATYAPNSPEAAMWGFLRQGGHGDGEKIARLLIKRATQLRCAAPTAPCEQPSTLSSGLGLFDSVHLRTAGPSPLILAHLFVPLP